MIGFKNLQKILDQMISFVEAENGSATLL